MIAPGSAPISFGLILNQPLQCEFGLLPPQGIPCGLMKSQETACQKSHSLGGVAFLDPQQGAWVEQKTSDRLLQCDAQELVFKCERTQERAQTIKCVIAAVIVFLKPFE